MRWLFLKDLRILARSPLVVALLVAYPVVIAALVGFAVTSGPDKPRVAVLNQVPETRQQIQLGDERVDVADEARPLFDAIDAVYVDTRAEAERKVRDGDVLAALIIPSDITNRLESAVQGAGGSARVEVLFNAEDPAKRRFVENTIKARVQEANAALAKRFAEAGAGYIDLLASGGQLRLPVLGRPIQVLGLERSEQILRGLRPEVPAAERRELDQVIDFAQLGGQNLGYAQTLLEAIGTPIEVESEVLEGGDPPLDAFAAAIAATVTLMFVTMLLGAGSLALEREENAFARLVRGLVSRTALLAEKVGLAALCSAAVGLLLLAGLSAWVSLPWDRFPLWLAALVAGAAAFGALGVAMGALAREVRAASLAAVMASVPLAVLALVPSGSVSATVYDATRAVSAAFPFRPTLDALESALGESGSIGGPLLHLAALTVAFGALARIALRRFA